MTIRPPEEPEAVSGTIGPGRLETDLACARCGYNLRGLDVTSACPECGLDVSLSSRDDRLVFADPIWLTKLSVGVGLLAASWAAAAMQLLFGLVIPGSTYGYVPYVVSWGAAGLALAGYWLSAVREPLVADQLRHSKLGMAVRVLVGCYVLNGFVGAWSRESRAFAYWNIEEIIGAAIILCTSILTLIRIRALSLRLRDDSLVKHIPIAIAGQVLLFGIAHIVDLVRTPSNTTEAHRVRWLLGLLLSTYLVYLLALMARRFAQAARRQDITSS